MGNDENSEFDPQEFVNSAPSGQEFNPEEFVNDQNQEKYSGLGQQLLTGVEGLAEGVAGPLATGAELGLSKLGVPGLTPEDISQRAKVNPVVHYGSEIAGFGGSMLTGIGEAALAGKAGAAAVRALAPEAATVAGRAGQAFIRNAIQGGIFGGGNEISKAMLGQGDPEHPVSTALLNVGASSLLTGTLGVGLSLPSAASEKAGDLLKNVNLKSRIAKEFVQGIGASSENIELPNPTRWQRYGQKAFESFHGALGERIAEHAVGATLGYLLPGDSKVMKSAEVLGGFLAGPVVARKIGPYLGPLIYKLLTDDSPETMEGALKYIGAAQEGQGKVTSAINNLFDYGASKAVDIKDPTSQIEKVKNYINNGGVSQEINQFGQEQNQPQAEGFAKGGEVKAGPMVANKSGIDRHFPEQNVLLSTAKGRVSNYLSSLNPKSKLKPKAFYDSDLKDPEAERNYTKACALAAQPLGIINHIKDGTLTAKQLDHFKNLYPECHNHLSKRMTERMLELKEKGEKPPYHMRQSLSLFLGSNLDSSLSQPNMAAAQAVFQVQQQQKAMGSSKASGLMKSAKNSLTAQQGAEARLNKN